tara:strand:+ start:17506 stop:18693 length:1188 start_codon:yes stop_codon:yes gene_type:complete
MALIELKKAVSIALDGIKEQRTELKTLKECLNRVLSDDLYSKRTNPPYSLSAMDGYAINDENLEEKNKKYKVVTTIPAGTTYKKALKKDQAARVYTGSRIPRGANKVVIQENVKRENNEIIIKAFNSKSNIRLKGFDFKKGNIILNKGTVLTAKNISISASMNYKKMPVYKKPNVAIISTGNELVNPGLTNSENKIINSSSYGISAYIESLGATPFDYGIVRDDINAIEQKINEAKAKADIIITIGGASVGDYDLVKKSIAEELSLKFWKIAMRPGKPLIFGLIENSRFLGLPGNPVSALVCCQLFLKPMIKKYMGINNYSEQPYSGMLTKKLDQNDERQDYLRAKFKNGKVTPHQNQDSSSLRVLNESNVFIVRKPYDKAKKAGDIVKIINIDL